MNYLDAILLGFVEGLTEFLPISSTGHLILTSYFLGIGDSEATKAFEIIIQGGAIAAVFWHYRRDLAEMLRGAWQKKVASRRELLAIVIAFLPAAIIGFLFSHAIKTHLFGIRPVIAAMIGGGLLLLLCERKIPNRTGKNAPSLQDAFWIGVAQCAALWPGVSRSMATLLGGRWRGLGPVEAARFSFLLALPTLLAATAYDLLKHRHELFVDGSSVGVLIVGCLVSFVVALLVIRAFLTFLGKYSLEFFAWYRIVIGLLLALILL